MRRGSPTQRQGRTRHTEVSPYRRGGRHPARVPQDRVPLGQRRQTAVPADPWRPPPLSGGRDPPAGRRAPSAIDGLSSRALQLAVERVTFWVWLIPDP